jgi:phosphatidylglycerophosphate synthase
VRGAADVLTLLRLAAAIAMPSALLGGGVAPVLLWTFAACSDFVDGPAARRWGGASRHGAMLDPVADVAFVLATFVTLAAAGAVAWLVPMAVVASVAAYAVASVRSSQALGEVRMAGSRVGHAAGVVNYAAAGVGASAVAWPASSAAAVLPMAAAVVVLVNVGAVVERSIRGQLARRAT